MKINQIVIFGCTQFSQMIADYIEKEGKHEIAAYSINRAYITEKICGGKPVVPYEDLELLYPPEKYLLLLAVGYQGMNQLREKVYFDAKRKGYEIYTYIHPTAYLMKEQVGEGSIVLEQVKIGYKSKLGKCNILFTGACINHHSKVGDFNYFSPESVLSGNVRVGNHCMFGTNCTIRDAVKIADYTLVGAGAYISNDTKENEVYVPARTVCLDKSSLDMHI